MVYRGLGSNPWPPFPGADTLTDWATGAGSESMNPRDKDWKNRSPNGHNVNIGIDFKKSQAPWKNRLLWKHISWFLTK